MKFPYKVKIVNITIAVSLYDGQNLASWKAYLFLFLLL